MYNGEGEMICSDGSKYIGEWKEDQANGKGEFIYNNGSKYTGMFQDDMYNG